MAGTRDHRVVVITGASSGIGRAAAIRFARDGWRVGLVARSGDGLDAARTEVIEAGGTACVAVADVADAAALDRAADQVEAELGPIDAWVNNAGVSVVGRFLDIAPDEFRRVTDTNYLGLVNGTRTALRRMMLRDRGTIVQVLSVLAYRSVPLQSQYCATMFAGRGFTEALRSELVADRSRVHVTMVHPPAACRPGVAADAILLAATTRRREVKVTGKFGASAQQGGQGFSGQTWASRNRGAVGLGLRLLGLAALAANIARAAPARGGPFGRW